MYNRYLNLFRQHYPAKKIAPLLAIIVALSPFAIDTYLPAIPTMAKYFNVDIHLIELSIPIYLIGFALGQITGGPISDNYGRRWIGIIGLSLFFLASLSIIFITNIPQLWLFRFIQAFGGGFGLVICSAVVRDLYDGKDAAKIFTLIGLIMMIAPLIAPTVGSLLLQYFSWRAIFILLAVYSIIQVFVILIWVPETKKLRKVAGYEHLSLKQVLGNYWSIISHKNAMAYLLCSSFVAASLFAFLTEISFLYIEYFAVSEEKFAWLFGLNIVSMMLFNRLNHYLLDYWQPKNILKLGLIIQTCSTLLLLLTALFSLHSLIIVVILLMITIGSFGIIAPNNMACYMSYFQQTSGTANAVIGSSQFALGAIIGLILAHLHNGTPFPMFGMMLAMTALGLLSFVKRNKSTTY
jgi:DHA1 family bicyclomycin/chloramphenicol resistance-like MFS transporter